MFSAFRDKHSRSIRPGQRALGAGVLLVCAVLGGLAGLDKASAAKPGGGGTTHTSRIYYTRFSLPTTFQMYENGADKIQVGLPTGISAAPSSQRYGGSPWWITSAVDPNTGFAELVGYREDGNPPVQLTAAGADVFLSYDIVPRDQARWSNDGQDRFLTFRAGTIGGEFLCRLWITAADIEAIRLGAPPFTAADVELAVPLPAGVVDYAWSNDDDVLALLVNDYDGNGNAIGKTIWMSDLSVSGSFPIYSRDNVEGAIKASIRWSPDGSRIAFSTHNSSSYGGAWTVAPDGSQLLKIKSNTGTMSYSSLLWSPDGSELLLHTIKDRGFGVWYYNLARIPAAGGTLTTLTSDVTQTSDKTAVGWVPLP
jgi:hypothetical protein